MVPCGCCEKFVSAKSKHQCSRCRKYLHDIKDDVHFPREQEREKECISCMKKKEKEITYNSSQSIAGTVYWVQKKVALKLNVVNVGAVAKIELCEFCNRRCNSQCDTPTCRTWCCRQEDARHGTWVNGTQFYCQNCAPIHFYNVS